MWRHFFIIFTAVADGKSMITRVSPMSWNSLNNIDIGGMTEYPGIVYVLTLYIVMIVVLSVIAVAWQEEKQVLIIQTRCKGADIWKI